MDQAIRAAIADTINAHAGNPELAPTCCPDHGIDLTECGPDCTRQLAPGRWYPRDWVLVVGWQDLAPDATDYDHLRVITQRASATWGIHGMLRQAAALYE